ncbi:MAG: hypothetical protein M5U08_19635 [Burkholderiales bacterium]|nr:hypothetical protein [Burkholderiales bacterium]
MARAVRGLQVDDLRIAVDERAGERPRAAAAHEGNEPHCVPPASRRFVNAPQAEYTSARTGALAPCHDTQGRKHR